MDDFIIRQKRDIPAVEILASDESIGIARKNLPRPLVVEIIRRAIDELKAGLNNDIQETTYNKLCGNICTRLKALQRRQTRRLINGTGILVHTNLGRAPLAESLFDDIKAGCTGYGNLEFDLNSGKRGNRGELAETYLTLLSEAESALMVNNNAAALFLILNTLAAGKKVIISRGEMVQIGGGFRIPDIIKKSGARLMEIGTSNITTPDDYKTALAENPVLILKVHRSNFAVSGFTQEVSLKELAELGQVNGIPVINDLGSGVFIDTTEIAGFREPTVQSSVHDGAALTCFSGDKLLGGPQAGLIVGQKESIQRLKKNPVYRALRVDKIVFSAMEKLLTHYLDDSWRDNIKLWRLAGIKEKELYERGRRILKQVNAGDKVVLEGSRGEMGGGALPEVALPSVALVFRSTLPAQKVAALFREAEPPVIGRIVDNSFIIDLKAIDNADEKILTDVIINFIDKI